MDPLETQPIFINCVSFIYHYRGRHEGYKGGGIILNETEYIVIMCDIKHLGDEPKSLGGEGNFVGKVFEARFDLPDNVDIEEKAVIQCRVKSNEIDNKRFLVNFHKLEDILMPHPEYKDEWLQDIAVVPRGFLTPGENIIDIGYTDNRYDDFLVDNIVMWYKRRSGTLDTSNIKNIDSLDHLAELNSIDVEKDEPDRL